MNGNVWDCVLTKGLLALKILKDLIEGFSFVLLPNLRLDSHCDGNVMLTEMYSSQVPMKCYKSPGWIKSMSLADLFFYIVFAILLLVKGINSFCVLNICYNMKIYFCVWLLYVVSVYMFRYKEIAELSWLWVFLFIYFWKKWIMVMWIILHC